MADKFLGIGGRSKDGLAKAIQTDKDGRIKTSNDIPEGVIIAENIIIGASPANGAGTEKTVVSTYTVDDATSIYLGVKANVNSVVSVSIEPVVQGFAVSSKREVMMGRTKLTGNGRGLTDKYELKTNTFRVAVVNYTPEDNPVTLYLYKSNVHTNTNKLELSKNLIDLPRIILRNVLVKAGEDKLIYTDYPVRDAQSIAVGVRSSSPNNVTLTVSPYLVDSNTYGGFGIKRILNNQPVNGKAVMSDRYDLLTPNITIRLKNHGDTDDNYTLYLYKLNMPTGRPEQMEYFGATVEDRPSVYSVPVGATYMAVNSSEIWQSNGNSWKGLAL